MTKYNDNNVILMIIIILLMIIIITAKFSIFNFQFSFLVGTSRYVVFNEKTRRVIVIVSKIQLN